MEEWRDIKGYEGHYQVSSLGRVKSLERVVRGGRGYRMQFVPEKILATPTGSSGYPIVTLRTPGTKKTYSVHRLVAETFIANPDNLPLINHKDENKRNNQLENLEYCDATYNNNYGTFRERVSKAKLVPVVQYSKSGEMIAEFESGMDAHQKTGVSRYHISACCNNRRSFAGGFIWKFK